MAQAVSSQDVSRARIRIILYFLAVIIIEKWAKVIYSFAKFTKGENGEKCGLCEIHTTIPTLLTLPNNPIMKELPKAYVAKDYEDQIYAAWEKSGAFQPKFNESGEGAPLLRGRGSSGKTPFVITMPPPNATGTLHLGHAVMLAVEDIMIRFHRMKGHPTLWIPGTDHAGIATQNKVERDVMEKEGKTRHDYGREKFVKMIEEFVAGSQNTIRNQTRKMGSSCDWSREYYSLDDRLNRTVFATFKKMFEDGLIYRGNRIVNWCTRCFSTISDDEVNHVETTAKLYTFRYDKDFPIEIATTRPET